MATKEGLKMVQEFLVYGRINQEDKQFLPMKNIFTSYYNKFLKYPYPDIQKTEEEIYDLMKIWTNPTFSNSQRSFNKQFCRDCDMNIQDVLKEEFRKIGINYNKHSEEIEKIMSDLGALVMQLKVFYNRPRAYQVAYYTGQDFNPKATITGNSPAYPSGHSTQSWFMGLYMGHLYPSQQKTILKLANDIADTRLVLGVHYPSDQEFGKWIAHTLFKDPRVKKHLFDE
jgi:hypothetical protein